MLAPSADVVVVVDVLRFTSAVSAAIESGCVVFPYRWADEGAADFAAEHGAMLAGNSRGRRSVAVAHRSADPRRGHTPGAAVAQRIGVGVRRTPGRRAPRAGRLPAQRGGDRPRRARTGRRRPDRGHRRRRALARCHRPPSSSGRRSDRSRSGAGCARSRCSCDRACMLTRSSGGACRVRRRSPATCTRRWPSARPGES